MFLLFSQPQLLIFHWIRLKFLQNIQETQRKPTRQNVSSIQVNNSELVSFSKNIFLSGFHFLASKF